MISTTPELAAVEQAYEAFVTAYDALEAKYPKESFKIMLLFGRWNSPSGTTRIAPDVIFKEMQKEISVEQVRCAAVARIVAALPEDAKTLGLK